MEKKLNSKSQLAAMPCSTSSDEDSDPYSSEDYHRIMEEAAKTCDADDRPCEVCLAGDPCDGSTRADYPSDDGSDDAM